MESNNIQLKSIGELLDCNFYIPSYQRGYRWTSQQVKDLLNDLCEFQSNGANGIYCIQPLVVKKEYQNDIAIINEIHSEKDLKIIEEKLRNVKLRWDVVDGQQRLTTILILLSYLENKNKYSIEYETRKKDEKSSERIKRNIGSKDFLNNIANSLLILDGMDFELSKIAESNIDYYHMYQTYKTIKGWFEGYQNDNGVKIETVDKIDKNDFLELLKEKVKFIWYETKELDPIKVFTRLNIGKIALTDAELIKALFLNSSNFKSENGEQIRLEQIGIATEWDKIEYSLQKDEFWLFINDNLNYSNPTRIDYILNTIREQDIFGLKASFVNCSEEIIGNDEYKTFRYFYEYFKSNKQLIDAQWLRVTWLKIKEFFQVFNEWYNDIELYHYVGYLVSSDKSAFELYNCYKGDKEIFKETLKERIKREIKLSLNLNRDYGENGEKKTECRSLLLLFNIQTIINQNEELKKNVKYGLGTFYKFPFHLYKKEGHKQNGKGWEVEHIASNSGDDLGSDKNQIIWLAAVLYSIQDDNMAEDIKNFIDGKEGHKDFREIQVKIQELDINPIKGIDKQKIWNYTLLDSSTNEEYQNDPFPIKRICVLSKEQGHKTIVSYNKETNRVAIDDKTTSSIAFVPPCTKNVFTKAYTKLPKSLSAWSIDDAEAYKLAIYETLEEFGVIK